MVARLLPTMNLQVDFIDKQGTLRVISVSSLESSFFNETVVHGVDADVAATVTDMPLIEPTINGLAFAL